jgi:hypothetical protein
MLLICQGNQGWKLSGSLQAMWSLPLQPVIAPNLPKVEMKPSFRDCLEDVASAYDGVRLPA